MSVIKSVKEKIVTLGLAILPNIFFAEVRARIEEKEYVREQFAKAGLTGELILTYAGDLRIEYVSPIAGKISIAYLKEYPQFLRCSIKLVKVEEHAKRFAELMKTIYASS